MFSLRFDPCDRESVKEYFYIRFLNVGLKLESALFCPVSTPIV